MKILSIGDTCVDIIVHNKGFKLERETSADIEMAPGGCACNFALAAAKLGMKVSLLARVGDDAFGDFIFRKLGEYRVGNMLRKSKLDTSASVILVDDGGKKAILSNKLASADLRIKDLAIGDFDLVYIGGYYHLPKLRGKLLGFLKRTRKTGKTIAMDLVCDREDRWEGEEMLPFVDILFGNEHEISSLMDSRLSEAIKSINTLNPDIITVVKKSGRGSEVHYKNEKFREEAVSSKVVDETGAGDAFNAGFLYANSKGFNMRESLRLGNFVGSRVVQRFGAQAGLPDKREVDRWRSTG